MTSPTFWNDQEKAREVISELKGLNTVLKPFEDLVRQAGNLEASIELAEEADTRDFDDEIRAACRQAESDFDAFEFRSMLGGPNDHCNAFVTIHAGAGGTEACDWAQMLVRMVTRWSEAQGFRVRIVDLLDGDEAGYRSCTLRIEGDFAYGRLKAERGVHRLVRISPYDANKRRHTTFASVDVLPVLEADPDIVVDEKDLRIDTYRAGGAGGQHVNKTESAVRITHLPTGVVVACQNERSQHANRKVAMEILHARLRQLEADKQSSEIQRLYGEKGEIAWGHQIRSYVMQPYTMVKDHRTGCETSAVQKVLDGGIDAFIDAYLKQRTRKP